jgi:hypothetical protein
LCASPDDGRASTNVGGPGTSPASRAASTFDAAAGQAAAAQSRPPPPVDPVFGVVPADLPPSVWALKPPWCQPWSIAATGAVAVAVAANVNPWLGGGVGAAVAAWWWLFLVQMLASYVGYVRQAQEEQGK